MEAQIKINKKKFATLKAKLTNIKKFIDQATNDTKPLEYTVRLDSLRRTFIDFESIQNDLTEQVDDDQEFSNLIESFTEFEETYFLLLSSLQSSVPEHTQDHDGSLVMSRRGSNEVSNSSDSAEIQLESVKAEAAKLPQIQVPTFNGDPSQWLTFKDTYMVLIHNNEKISNIVKFIYLLDKLKGDARETVGHITLTAAGYHSAWSDLIQTYDNARLIVEVHIDALCNLSQIKKDSAQELRILSNACRNHISSLEACGLEIAGLGEQVLIHIITKKFDVQLRKDWEDKLTATEMPTWPQLKEFLRIKSRVLESVEATKKQSDSQFANSVKFNNKTTNNFNKGYKKGNSFVLSNESAKDDNNRFPHHKINTKQIDNGQNLCGMCQAKYHPLFVCQSYFKLSPVERLQKAKDFKVCINCLGKSHAVDACKSIGCRVCNSRHHTLLHDSMRNNTAELATCSIQDSQNMHAATNTQNMQTSTEILLSTAVIQIQDKSGTYHNCRALLDSGSQSNFIVSSLANKLGIDKTNITNLTISGINQTKTLITQGVSTKIKSRSSRYNKFLNFLVIPQISGALPQTSLNISSWNIPSNLALADPSFYISRPVEALLGAEVFFEILGMSQIKLNQGIPTIHESLFGWIISGRSETPLNRIQQSFHTRTETDCFDELSQSIKRFWEIETIPAIKFLSDDEKQCEEIFSKTFSRTESGRYVVSLPVRNNATLGESKTNALKRFQYLEKRLSSNAELKLEYTEFINEYLSLGHMIESPNQLSHTYFLPHHAVLKPSSSSTKLRVVFDASAKTSNNLSLNNILLTGPTVQQDLLSIVLRFRKYQYAFTADISKMYRQILINPSQTNLQTILWRASDAEPIKAYKLLTVTYGTASAPYLATRVLMQLAEDEKHNFPSASKVTKTDFYVDDVLAGSDTLDGALHIQNELISMLKTGGFELHKWCATSDRLLDSIPPQNREKLKKNEFNGSESIKTLGLTWIPDQDIFVFDILPPIHFKILTKRIILSEIAKLYDPLGLLGPIIIVAKMQIQSLWKLQVDWDDELTLDQCTDWINFRDELCAVNQIKLGRCVISPNSILTELHGFSDASEKAYGACVYIKTIDDRNNISVNLLCSKSRVAPLKSLTLPRLELCGALLLSKLVNTVIKSMDIDFNDVILWSDSTITLCWINTAPFKLKTFVANRVNDIQEITSNYTWQHIPSGDNPADLLTRGISPAELQSAKLWWCGPDILYHMNEYGWSLDSHVFDRSQELEFKQEAVSLATFNSPPFDLLSKYSSFKKLIRVTSFCLRFINNITKANIKIVGPLTVTETDGALTQLCKIVQSDFQTEIKCLRQGNSLPNSSALKQLNPFLDSHSLIRVGGRLSKSNLAYDVKHQILLPSKSNFTRILFRQEHEQNLHAGPQLLLSLVRQKYWPINGKSISKQVIRNCVVCAKAKPVQLQQIMGDLPPERITPSRPFNVTGVDFCGPFLIKNKYIRKSNASKVFVAAFVCFATKAIHLDIVSDLTSESFIACLKRFISRRGKIKSIYSDNAKTFVGADNELRKRLLEFNKQLQDETLVNFCCSEGIQWKFIPPRAPNFGGLWESAVKSFKTHLKRITNGTHYTYEEFYTLIVQIEGILNSRPLSTLSSDPNDPLPLTPGHFLTGGSIKSIIEPLLEESQSVLSKWKKVTLAIQSFWKRYSVEYLHTLQSRTKWKDSKPDLKAGDVVLILEETSIVANWLLGLVVTVYSGSDGRIRVVDVKTKNGIYKRVVSKICKLPVA